MTTLTEPSPVRLLNRVPKVTVDFWLVKLLAVTVGETFADYLSGTLGLGLSRTSWIFGAVMVGVLVLQFAQRKYVPWVYWIAVVMISIVGTLITDNLTDNYGISLATTTTLFAAVLAAIFVAWYSVEKTLSIHTIFTMRREAFYWLAILFTFALGTAAGDLTAEGLSLGYLQAGLGFGAVIAVIALAYYALRLNAVLAFWLAYILTRPLGASFGDLFSQAPGDGGLGFGPTDTSFIFLACIALLIVYMTLSHDGDESFVEGVGEAAGLATESREE